MNPFMIERGNPLEGNRVPHSCQARKDGSKGTPKLGPYWKLLPVNLHGKQIRNLVFEQRQYSLLGQNFSWIKQVCDEFQQLEEYALQMDAKDITCRSKAKTKPQRREPAGFSPRTVPIGKRIWTDGSQGNIFSPILKFRKKWCIFFVIHNKCRRWSSSFWRIQDNLHKHFPHSPSV